jgi:hypothetical protein
MSAQQLQIGRHLKLMVTVMCFILANGKGEFSVRLTRRLPLPETTLESLP